MELKCISTRDSRTECDMPAEYIYLGKSYCRRHMLKASIDMGH